MRPVRTVLLVLGALLLAGCGGGGDDGDTAASPSIATTATGAPAPTVTVAPPEEPQADPTPTGDPTFTITLTAESHTPKAGRPWSYTVRARSMAGGIAGGTAKIRVFVNGEAVDTIGFFGFDGQLKRTHNWPPSLRGEKGVVLQAEVEGDGGTQRANWPVVVS